MGILPAEPGPEADRITALLTRAGIPIADIQPSNGSSVSSDGIVVNGVYQWHTFYGSTNTDFSYAIAIDDLGGFYIVGQSKRPWNGPAGQLPLHGHTGARDIIVIKLDSAGNYQWHTFYGSVEGDIGYDIAVDASNGVYVVGYSGLEWNGPAGQVPLHAYSGSGDITVLKLDSAGAYQWHTFYGSTGEEVGNGIDWHENDGIYLNCAGNAEWKGPAGQEPLNAYHNLWDITVLKLDQDGAYQWHTFYGSEANDTGYGIIVDSNLGVYAAASSEATWNGPGDQTPLHPFGGTSDLTVLKLSTAGDYQWHTFYGSENAEGSSGITIDGSGGVYLSGNSSGSWNGSAGQPPLHAYSGGYEDITVLKLDTLGGYQWHTFYGSPAGDFGYGINWDGSGILVAGESGDAWQGPANQLPLNPYSGSMDMHIIRLNASGEFQWHTFYGSPGDDSARMVIPYGEAGIYAVGSSLGAWTGPADQDPLTPYSGDSDVVLFKLQSGLKAVMIPFVMKQ